MSAVIGRVTSGMTARAAQHHLQANLQRMSTLMERASGQRAILRPSDDPVGTGDSLRLRSEQRAAEQHARNTQDGLGWLTVADSAIRTSVDLLVRARDLALQGATGTASQQARDALAEEIDGIRDALLTEANASYNGRSVFAGTSDAGVAFSEDGTFQGVPGSSVVRRIGPDEQLRVDVDGAAVFGSGAGSVFAVLETLAADLRAGADMSGSITAISERREEVLGHLSQVGVRYNRLEAAKVATEQRLGRIEAGIVEVEDVDLARMIIDLKSQEVAYQSALGVTARVLQNSLMDFIR